jgi:hypothetical protein
LNKLFPIIKKSIKSLEDFLLDDLGFIAAPAAILCGAYVVYRFPLIQHILNGANYEVLGYRDDAVAVFLLIFTAIAVERRKKSSPQRILTCPQGVLIYRITAILQDRELLETKIKEMLAANPHIDFANYEHALPIKVIRFDSTRKTSRSSQPGRSIIINDDDE